MRIFWGSKMRKPKDASLRTADIKEVREGRKTAAFQRAYENSSPERRERLGGDDGQLCFSIIYGEHYQTLELVAASRHDYNVWQLAMAYFIRRNAVFSLGDVAVSDDNPRDTWLRDAFEQADENGDQQLSLKEVRQMLARLNVNMDRKVLARKFHEADKDGRGTEGHGKLDYKEFCAFYKALTRRPDVGRILRGYGQSAKPSGRSSKAFTAELDTFDDVFFTPQQLADFCTREQMMADVDEAKAAELIAEFEPARKDGNLGVDGMTALLVSPTFDAFNPEHRFNVYQDMTRPLAHYFIASSHNTYLTEDQVRGRAATT